VPVTAHRFPSGPIKPLSHLTRYFGGDSGNQTHLRNPARVSRHSWYICPQNLVHPTGFEPVLFRVRSTVVFPVDRRMLNVVGRAGIEPASPESESGVLPLN
jgi:hypothetical protein